jgi:hypothetical protein
MTKNSNGSVLVVVLVAITLFLVVTLARWYSVAQLRLLAQARITCHKERALVEGLLNAAISYSLERPQECFNPRYDKQSWQMVYDPWPAKELVASLGHYTATITLEIKNNAWYIVGILKKAGVAVRRGSCTIIPQKEAEAVSKTSVAVRDWIVQ